MGLLQRLDRFLDVARTKRELREPPERPAARNVVVCALESLCVEVLRDLDLVEAKRDLRLEQRIAGLGLRAADQKFLARCEPLRELAEELQRRDPLAALDARDIDGAAARERELPLAQPRLLASRLQAGSECDRVIDVSPVTFRHFSPPLCNLSHSCKLLSAATPGPGNCSRQLKGRFP